MSVDMNSLYDQNPGTTDATAQNAAAAHATSTNATAAGATSRDASTEKAGAAGYDANLVDVSNDATSAGQAQKIMSTDSPLMQQAKNSGMLTAASRGLMNSSISAGASEAEMAKAAVPLALQDAQTYATAQTNNQAAINKAAEFSTGAKNTADITNATLGTDVNKTNATLTTDVSKTNAALGTDVSKTNAEGATDVSKANAAMTTKVNEDNADRAYDASKTNAAAANTMVANILSMNTDLNKQFLVGTQALDLQQIGKKYDLLIQNSAEASTLYNNMVQAIGQAMNVPGMTPSTIASYVGVLQTMLSGGLATLDAISGVDLKDFQNSPPTVAPPTTGGSNPATPPTPTTTPTTTPTMPNQPGTIVDDIANTKAGKNSTPPTPTTLPNIPTSFPAGPP
jgi:hypothetical protein